MSEQFRLQKTVACSYWSRLAGYSIAQEHHADEFNAVKEYVRKEYRENIKQAEKAGLLIEHWPGAMDNAGRNKRKAYGFEADEIDEAVKRSRFEADEIEEAVKRSRTRS
ncbi:hypothetical protein RhiirA4_469689 [Rhizophagus irregularis]|uniref:Uncharacterized protein n=1 Tax=Rhizophagus irregularis TaxID=588596 RepID=A0A2I1H042_9GLOM|nr:hypothetical protein RhiirA4_469689 [Rhizophagus irregularis]